MSAKIQDGGQLVILKSLCQHSSVKNGEIWYREPNSDSDKNDFTKTLRFYMEDGGNIEKQLGGGLSDFRDILCENAKSMSNHGRIFQL